MKCPLQYNIKDYKNTSLCAPNLEIAVTIQPAIGPCVWGYSSAETSGLPFAEFDSTVLPPTALLLGTILLYSVRASSFKPLFSPILRLLKIFLNANEPIYGFVRVRGHQL